MILAFRVLSGCLVVAGVVMILASTVPPIEPFWIRALVLCFGIVLATFGWAIDRELTSMSE